MWDKSQQLQNTQVKECILLKYFINEWMINTIYKVYMLSRVRN